MDKIALRYGLWMFAGFTAFFLLMHLFGQSDNYHLRIFNGVIHMTVLFLAIRYYHQHSRIGASNYLSGVGVGMYTSAFGVIGFSVFLFLFLVLDPKLLQSLRETIPSGQYINPVTATLYVIVEGTVVSLIGSYIITRIVEMNYSKAR